MKLKSMVLGFIFFSSALAFGQEIDLPRPSSLVKVQVSSLDSKLKSFQNLAFFLTPASKPVMIDCGAKGPRNQLSTEVERNGIHYNSGFRFENSSKCLNAVESISDLVSKNGEAEIVLDLKNDQIVQISNASAAVAK